MSRMLRCKPQTKLNAPRRDGELSMLRLKPLAQAIALLMVAGNAHAATAFSSAWFAAKGASQAGGAGRPTTAKPGMPPPLAQQQRANAQLQRSLTNLNNTVARSEEPTSELQSLIRISYAVFCLTKKN